MHLVHEGMTYGGIRRAEHRHVLCALTGLVGLSHLMGLTVGALQPRRFI
jgi:hypothetical protein